MEEHTDQNADRTASRRGVLASSAVGAAMFGASGLVGTAAADDGRPDPTTPEEVEQSLAQAEILGLRQKYADRVDKSEIDSVSDLDPKMTVGEGHPNIYFGEYKNAEPPSGHYYSLSNTRAEVNSPGIVSASDDDVTGDLYVFEETLGCQDFPIPFVDDTICVDFEVGVTTTWDPLAFELGGELFVSFVFKHPSTNAQLTVSPLGFGFSVSPGEGDSLCLGVAPRLPGPIPGKANLESCAAFTFNLEGDEIKLGFEFTSLELCVENVCVNMFAPSLGFEWSVGKI